MSAKLFDETKNMLNELGIYNFEVIEGEKYSVQKTIHTNIAIRFTFGLSESVNCVINLERKEDRLGHITYSYQTIDCITNLIGFGSIDSRYYGIFGMLEIIKQLSQGKSLHSILISMSIEKNEKELLQNLAEIRKLEEKNRQLQNEIKEEKRRLYFV